MGDRLGIRDAVGIQILKKKKKKKKKFNYMVVQLVKCHKGFAKKICKYFRL
jgi:hypothetical protein